MRHAGQAATRAAQALKTAVLRYRRGATTSIEVIDAEQQARNMDLAAAQAHDNAREVLNGIRSMNEVFPLERVAEGFEPRLSDKAPSRDMLTRGKPDS